MGILAGLPKEKVFFNDGSNFYVKVKGAEIKSTAIPEMVEIVLKATDGLKLLDESEYHFCFYHFENADSKYISLNPPSTPFWIAIGMGLCEFFGGKIDFDDCDDKDIDRTYKKPRTRNNPHDNDEYHKFQKQIWKLESLGIDELVLAKGYSAYQNLLAEEDSQVSAI
jgi:hypothetical protein